jgi:hypothetical protein
MVLSLSPDCFAIKKELRVSLNQGCGLGIIVFESFQVILIYGIKRGVWVYKPEG